MCIATRRLLSKADLMILRRITAWRAKAVAAFPKSNVSFAVSSASYFRLLSTKKVNPSPDANVWVVAQHGCDVIQFLLQI